ncbi:unnamed protein product [Linum tenue]|uniref:RING-type domain-containing protein n=1 Tax=Linum tenue TaxID=586396 RepID=A0AAV0JZQ1_9ROSI|nr:unnamed protein product [Linum tenue]
MENNYSGSNTANSKSGSEAEPKPNDPAVREQENHLPKDPIVPAPVTNGEAATAAAAVEEGGEESDVVDLEEDDEVEEVEEEEDRQQEAAPARQSAARTPFTNLSQEDADLALARTLQEQERAYMMLSRASMSLDGETEWVGGGSYLGEDEDDEDFDDPDDVSDGHEYNEHEYGESEELGEDDVDAFDVHARAEVVDDDGPNLEEMDPSAFSSDEAYARALQDNEEREMAARLFALAGINDRAVEYVEQHGAHSQVQMVENRVLVHLTLVIGNQQALDVQDTWEEVDPDELSYEELLALGEVVGTESRGLSADTIANLPSVNYKSGSNESGTSDSCVICRLDYEDEETVTVLSCKHSYHAECINNWLQINKVCPVCSTEVLTVAGGSQSS